MSVARLLPWLVSALLGALYFVNLDTRVVLDEPWHSIAPYRLATLGSLSDPVTWPGEFAKEHLLTRPVYNVLLAGTYRVFGLGVEQGRLLSLAFAGLALLATFHLARLWYDRRTAVWTVPLLLANSIFFLSARTLRPDIVLAAAVAALFLCYYRGRATGSAGWFGAAGAIGALGLLVHPNMVLPIVALGVLALREDGVHAVWRRSGNWIFAGALVATCLPFVAHVVLVDGPNHFANLAEQYMVTGRSKQMTGAGGAWDSLRGELGRYARYGIFPYRTPIALIELACLGFLAWRRAQGDRRILWLVVVHAVLFVVLISNKNVRYLTMLMPFASIAVATTAQALPSLVERAAPGAGWRRRAGVAFAAGYAALCIAGNVGLLATTRDSGYRETFATMQEVVPEDAVIFGSFTTWFLFPDHEYYGCGRHSVQSMFATVHPSIVIWDRSDYCTRYTAPEQRELLRSVLEREGRLLLTIEQKHYGTYDVYALPRKPLIRGP